MYIYRYKLYLRHSTIVYLNIIGVRLKITDSFIDYNNGM